ncbi:hypothetical protein ACP70R_034659 [Stipagrostis hirtigluma subsp. patula]
MSNPSDVVRHAEAPPANTEPEQLVPFQPPVNDVVDRLGDKSADVTPVWNLRRNHWRVGRRSRRRRVRFSLRLTEAEVIGDLYAMTGEVSRNRPRRRSTTLQMVLDSLVPGAPVARLTLP